MAAYPEINSYHVVSQRPYSELEEWNTTQNEMDCGKVYTWSEHQHSLRRFIIEYESITLDEATILDNFFQAMGGSTGEFDFKNDVGETLGQCRFDMKEFALRHLGPNEYAVTVRIAAPKF